MNSVNLIGRAGADPELKFTPKGTAVCELNLAVDDGFGENKKTAWIGVTVWGKTAEIAAQYVRKGDRVGITGRLTQDEWEDKTTGKKQRKTKVTAEGLHLIGSSKQDGEPRQPRERPVSQNEANHDEDDIPF